MLRKFEYYVSENLDRSRAISDFACMMAALRNKDLLNMLSENIEIANIEVAVKGLYDGEYSAAVLDTIRQDHEQYQSAYDNSPHNRQLLNDLLETNSKFVHGDKRRSLELPESRYVSDFMTGDFCVDYKNGRYCQDFWNDFNDSLSVGLFGVCDNLDRLEDLKKLEIYIHAQTPASDYLDKAGIHVFKGSNLSGKFVCDITEYPKISISVDVPEEYDCVLDKFFSLRYE